jgi:hypothetical protein
MTAFCLFPSLKVLRLAVTHFSSISNKRQRNTLIGIILKKILIHLKSHYGLKKLQQTRAKILSAYCWILYFQISEIKGAAAHPVHSLLFQFLCLFWLIHSLSKAGQGRKTFLGGKGPIHLVSSKEIAKMYVIERKNCAYYLKKPFSRIMKRINFMPYVLCNLVYYK